VARLQVLADAAYKDAIGYPCQAASLG